MIESDWIGHLGKDRLFVTENHRTGTRQPGTNRGDASALLGQKGIEIVRRLRTGPDQAEIAGQDIDKLGKLVELGLAQEAANREHTGIIGQGELARTDACGVLHHRCELEQTERFAASSDPDLPIEDRPLSREA